MKVIKHISDDSRAIDSHWEKAQNNNRQQEFNLAGIKVIENVNHSAGVVSYVYGGG